MPPCLNRQHTVYFVLYCTFGNKSFLIALFLQTTLIYSSLQSTGHPPISTNTPCNLLIIKAGFSLYWGHLASHFLARTPATWCFGTTSLYFNFQDKQSKSSENRVSSFKRLLERNHLQNKKNNVIFGVPGEICTVYSWKRSSFVPLGVKASKLTFKKGFQVEPFKGPLCRTQVCTRMLECSVAFRCP